MFTMTKKWLREHYGSASPDQCEQMKQWLLKYGKGFAKPSDIVMWSNWKHLAEYSINTNNIVPIALQMVGKEFRSELEAHRLINLLRVPLAKSYENALDIVKPKTILELGVGGDSAISTSIFLAYLERMYVLKKGKTSNYKMLSVDRNPLGVALNRYSLVHFWDFVQGDSIDILKRELNRGKIYDLVFIDTIHSFEHTIEELKNARYLTNNILLDDATFEGNEFDAKKGGVKRAINEFLTEYAGIWRKIDIGNDAVCLLTSDSRSKKQSKKKGTKK